MLSNSSTTPHKISSTHAAATVTVTIAPCLWLSVTSADGLTTTSGTVGTHKV